MSRCGNLPGVLPDVLHYIAQQGQHPTAQPALEPLWTQQDATWYTQKYHSMILLNNNQ
jgi:hypothetical protein